MPQAPIVELSDLRHGREGEARISSMAVTGDRWSPGSRLVLRAEVGPDAAVDPTATPFLPIATVLACAHRADLVVAAPVDERALVGAKAAARLVADWFGWRAAGVTAPRERHRRAPGAGVALFFSRGLDSMASAIAGRGELTHLVGLDWRDPPYEGAPMREVWRATTDAAGEARLPLVGVSTNARAFLDPVVAWDHCFGALLASLGLLLAPFAREVRVSSSYRDDLEPPSHGSHRDLDPLWSSSEVEIVHDGSGGRVDKARLVARDPFACRWLKVCWERAGDGNCGRCAKCLMTMTNFLVVGALPAVAGAFDAPLSATAVRAAAVRPYVGANNTEELLEYLPAGHPLREPWTEVLDAAHARHVAPGALA